MRVAVDSVLVVLSFGRLVVGSGHLVVCSRRLMVVWCLTPGSWWFVLGVVVG